MTHNALVPGTNVLVIVGAVHQETDGHTDRGKKHNNTLAAGRNVLGFVQAVQ